MTGEPARADGRTDANPTPPLVQHHPIFAQFEPYTGPARPAYFINFVGAQYRTAFRNGAEGVASSPPPLTEEYFEWIDLLEAVSRAEDRFVMFELGAGFGRWMINGACAMRRSRNLPFFLLGVEAEPTHFEWLQQALDDNQIDAANYEIYPAAMSDRGGTAFFHFQFPPEAFYGQALVQGRETRRRALRKATVVDQYSNQNVYQLGRGTRALKVRRMKLRPLLRRHPIVDLIDLDVQGAELAVLSAAAREVNRRVKRVHIGTHSEAIEAGLRELFGGLGWQCVWDFSLGKTHETPYGPVSFNDGVQGWINPRFHAPQ